MEIFYWAIIILLFIGSFIGLVYPIIPSMLLIGLGFILYGLFFSFEELGIWFWVIQGLLIVLLFIADYAGNLIGVKKFGGSKAAGWGSTIGLLIGPFVIPVAGILIGPFLGAILAELIVEKKGFKLAVKVGVGSVIGFLSSTIAKLVIQIIMLVYFFIVIF
ncbi:uncharacterized protein YqgC (DUF456 family) [Bacillus mesophilus]|uniref:DUF456 family protein n=1 Tax=Bacillus mesophilus TaxID=1808955 RepID=A0A6M0Q5J5_9BACI|nr:DUF456 family protein [Bacillus mesophilus]MBM7660826.1 uncharacterized protein YqgC (DUF456 family) [Bacillus mesophilus]NEY71627.1 DUF456 family protein [Bacillus mesophilus]